MYGISVSDDMRELIDERFRSRKAAHVMLEYLGIPSAFIVRFDGSGRPRRVTREPRIRSIGLSGDIATIGYSEAIQAYRDLRDNAESLPAAPARFNGDRLWYLYERAGVESRVYFAIVRKVAEREAYAEAHRFDRVEREYDAAWAAYDEKQAKAARIVAMYESGESLPDNWADIVREGLYAVAPELPEHEVYNRLWYAGEASKLPANRYRGESDYPIDRDPLIGRGEPLRCGAKRRERLERQARAAELLRAVQAGIRDRIRGERHALYCERRAGLSRVHRNPYAFAPSEKARAAAKVAEAKAFYSPRNSPDETVRAVARGLACWISERPTVATPRPGMRGAADSVVLVNTIPARDMAGEYADAMERERLRAYWAALGGDNCGRGPYGRE